MPVQSVSLDFFPGTNLSFASESTKFINILVLLLRVSFSGYRFGSIELEFSWKKNLGKTTFIRFFYATPFRSA